MSNKLLALGLVLVLSALIVSGCGTATPMEVAEEVPVQVREARDAALAHVSEQYGDQAPASGLHWTEENVTPKDWVGSAIYEFTAGDWVVTIYVPVLPPERIVHKITVTNQATRFEWEGKVDASGQVTESSASAEPVVDMHDPGRALHVALAYINERYGEQAPPLGLTWAGDRPPREEPVGGETIEFTSTSAPHWTVTVSYAVVAPEAVVYQVTVTSQITGFQWRGEVDASGRVTEQPVPESEWFDPVRARDAALAYVVERYGEQVPGPDLAWAEENITPGFPDEPVLGSAALQYSADDWVVTVSYPVVPPEQVVYQVAVTNQATGFQWDGEVDAAGRVETAEHETADWKTYTNERYGYSLRYPSDCTFGPLPAHCKQKPPEERTPECLCFLNVQDPGQVFLQAFTGEEDDLKAAEFSVTRLAFDPPPGADLIDWIREKLPHYEEIPNEPNATVGKVPAVRLYAPRSPQAFSYEEIYFIKDDKFFRILMYDVDEDANRELYDRISSTLDISVEAPIGRLPVVGWYGGVVSLPAGGQYDDYLSLVPEGAGEIGVEGADEAIEAQIVALRDKEEPGKYAHFWGSLTCDVPDYGGCQLVVTRLRVDRPGLFFDPDLVEGWEGAIVGTPPRAQFDDYFALAGDFPVGYGIDSLDPTLAAQLESLRDSGTIVRVWGQVECGVIDTYGSRIEVTRIEVAGEPPVPAPLGEPVACWYGRVDSTPADSAIDDYLVLLPEEARRAVDVVGADEVIEAEIEALRDSGTYAHFWGTLNCDVPGWGGCQLVATRLRPEGPGGPLFGPDPVEGWTGSIFSLPDDAQFDDYFVLSGSIPMRYGIDSLDAAVAAQLESLHDAGSIVRVWGQVTCPAIDIQGTQIQVARIEVAIEAPAEEEGYEGWKTYTSAKLGYTLRYPGQCMVMGTDLDEAVQFAGQDWPVLTVRHYDSDFYHPPAGTDVRQWIADRDITYDEIDLEAEIAGLPAAHLTYKEGPGWYASDEYYFIRGDQLFSILILHTGGQQDWELYNKFLQSFTFP